jgi:hypothetical protein
MTDEEQLEVPEGEDDDEAMRALLKRAVVDAPIAAESPSLLPGVQRRIRQRSKGKFFSDGWSTSQTRLSYVVVALVMLMVIAVAYLALGPTGFTAR